MALLWLMRESYPSHQEGTVSQDPTHNLLSTRLPIISGAPLSVLQQTLDTSRRGLTWRRVAGGVLVYESCIPWLRRPKELR